MNLKQKISSIVESVLKELNEEVHEADYEAYKTLYDALAAVQKDLGKLMHDPDALGSNQAHEAIVAKLDAAKQEFSNHNQSYWKQMSENTSPYSGGSTKLICRICYNNIRAGNVYSGKNNQWKWILLDDKPVDFHVWENCHKCQSFNTGGKRYEAKVKRDL